MQLIGYESRGQSLRLQTTVFTMMKLLSLALVFQQCAAFVPAGHRTFGVPLNGVGSASELDLPCEDECAIEKYPNLPDTVHPGVLSGQAQVDLLKHAKENGK